MNKSNSWRGLSLILLSLLIGNVMVLHAQDLIVDGAEWYYNLHFFSSPDVGITRCYIAGDTTILDKNCLVFMQEVATCNGRPEKNYLHKDDKQVYFFDQDDNTFKLLYDFSLEAGDTLIYNTGIHSWDNKRRTHYIRIDSVGKYRVNSIELKLFDLSYGWMDGNEIFFEETSAQIIEGIGNTENFFHLSDGTGYCDDKYSDKLECFSNPNFATAVIGSLGCTIVNTKDMPESRPDLVVYPNPFTNTVDLETSVFPIDGKVFIYDSSGKIIYRESWPDGTNRLTLSLEELIPSVYWLELVHVQSSMKSTILRMILKNDF